MYENELMTLIDYTEGLAEVLEHLIDAINDKEMTDNAA